MDNKEVLRKAGELLKEDTRYDEEVFARRIINQLNSNIDQINYLMENMDEQTRSTVKGSSDMTIFKTNEIIAAIRAKLSADYKAKVYDNAKVYGDARVFDSAKVYRDARVFDSARVSK